MNAVLNENLGLQNIKHIENILSGTVDEDIMKLNHSPNEITAVKYAPITSYDVECSLKLGISQCYDHIPIYLILKI